MSTETRERAAMAGTGIYFAIFAILIVATFVTWQIAYLDLGRLNVVAALLIAGFKATLVVWFFMHARSSSRLIWLVAFGGLLWVLILLGLTASDYLTR